MRRLFLAGVLLALCGCHNVVGPLQPKKPERVDDPLLTIGEQEQRGRANLALPITNSEVTPQQGGVSVRPGTPLYGR
jgi:hypothetical protein